MVSTYPICNERRTWFPSSVVMHFGSGNVCLSRYRRLTKSINLFIQEDGRVVSVAKVYENSLEMLGLSKVSTLRSPISVSTVVPVASCANASGLALWSLEIWVILNVSNARVMPLLTVGMTLGGFFLVWKQSLTCWTTS